MKFTKAVAAGNDFILIDNREKKHSGREREFFKSVCRRRFAVGADGVILLEESARADILYRHFNPDGCPAEMCGNGARCLGLYAYKKQITGASLSFEINETIYYAVCSGNAVTITFPYPELVEPYKKVFTRSDQVEAGFIHTGVPHFVLFTENLDAVDVQTEGTEYRSNPAFPQGTNVDFVQVLADGSIKIRTFERGVEAETLSCGTGAVAAAFLSHIQKGLSPPLQVRTRGGELRVDWDKHKQNVFLSGTAELVYEGEFIFIPQL
jgi:diaminopimelate epimerase